MTEEYKIDTVSIILSEMLKESRNEEITKGEFWKLPNKYAERIVKLFAIPDVIKSVCDDCTAYPFDERGKTPLCKTCKDNPKQTVL